MMKASISSSDREMVRYEENDDDRRIVVGSVLEMFHYIVPAYRFFRFARAMDKEEGMDLSEKEDAEAIVEGLEKEVEESGDNNVESSDEKPLRLKIGFLNLRIG